MGAADQLWGGLVVLEALTLGGGLTGEDQGLGRGPRKGSVLGLYLTR